MINARKEEAQGAAEEDSGLSTGDLPAVCLHRGGSICAGSCEAGAPQAEGVEHVPRPRGTEGPCGLSGRRWRHGRLCVRGGAGKRAQGGRGPRKAARDEAGVSWSGLNVQMTVLATKWGREEAQQ